MGGLFRPSRITACLPLTNSSISHINIMDESITLASTSHAGLKNSSYSNEFKLKAVQFAEECNSNRKAAAKFGVDRKRVREWRQKKSKLEDTSSKRKRLEGGGRKPFDEDLEEALLQWVHERRSNGLRVSRKMIASKAKFFDNEKCKEKEMPPSFLASSGWLQRFVSRHGLAIRRKTTESQKDPEKLIDKLIAYVLQIRRQRKKIAYQNRDIIAMDETAVWQDMVSNTTVDNIGESTIRLKTTGHEKTKVSVCLTAKGDGTKLKPFIVFPGAKRESKALNEEFRTKCVVASSINGWMNEELTVSWVKSVLGQFSFTRRMLAWDSFRCHVLDSVKQELNRAKIDPVIIPGGCTKYIQAPDVSWNKPFKAKVTERYDEWMANGQHTFTAAGNMRAPPRREIVQWIIEAWNDLDKDIIVNSFKCCALTLAVDSSQDELIHCLKPSQPCHSGLAQLKAVQQQLQQTLENDPFQDITLSDVEDAAPVSTLLDDSDTEIEID